MNMLESSGTKLVVHLPVELDHHYTEEIRKEVDLRIRDNPEPAI